MADVETTRALLGAIISRPKLSDKLLGKPPFRFLHDVVMNVAKATGFGSGLYSGDELDSKAKRDKAGKIAFLNKIIACVGIVGGSPVDVNPSKIVAGREADKTNNFLQELARVAADADTDSDAAVQRALAGEQPGDGPPARKGGGGGGGEGKGDDGAAA